MDLIYADENKKELGVIQDYTLDIAFGKNENDFSLAISLDDNCCKESYSVYIEGTEYGGIVDKVNPDTRDSTITYEGRTWHGILEGNVIEPDSGQDYFTVDGEANTVIAEIIALLGLTSLFTVSTDDSEIEVNDYQFERYIGGYTGIRKMLYASSAKLVMEHKDGFINLSAVPLYDYSTDESWDSSQLTFKIEKNYRPTNHLVCLGSGNLKDRHVIHLFTDVGGGVQPYVTVAEPYQDSHYILGKNNQLLFGTDEVTEVYDYGNAQTTVNYILLVTQPLNWKSVYVYYYYKDGDTYKLLERAYSDTYTLQTASPSDWAQNYANYYLYSSGSYKNVEGVETTTYAVQTAQPADWKKHYKNYFYYWSDGTEFEYKSVSGITKYKYVTQTLKPSDWTTTYTDYYSKIPVYGYVYTRKYKSTNGVWKKEKVTYSAPLIGGTNTRVEKLTFIKRIVTKYNYTKISAKKAPKWVNKRYYTQESYSKAPKWQASYYYTEINTASAPTWKVSKYYTLQSVETIPSFKTSTYYQMYTDDYADLVGGGLSKLKESYNCDSIEITLDAEEEYDINDIVGATEKSTKISIFQPITKKIVSFKNGNENIDYEIGE